MLHIARFIIAEIYDKDINPNFIPQNRMEDYSVRRASRGVLVRNGKIALLNVTKSGYHKLPGGGIVGNETNEEAFTREVLEETGFNCIFDNENDQNSVVLEFRDQLKLVQISYAFIAKAIGEPKIPDYTDEELEHGFKLEWIPFNQITEALEKDTLNDYEGHFIQRRDKAIIDFYRKLLV